MQLFLEKLRAIVAESHNSRVDYYFVLSEMKNADFFSEVLALSRRSQPPSKRTSRCASASWRRRTQG